MHAKRDFALAYLLLVVLPLLGLAGVLRQGRKLTAPIAVGGLWKMQVSPDHLTALPCGRLLAAAQDAVFTISQSGKMFTLNFANSAMSSAWGHIEGTKVQADLALSPEAEKKVACQTRAAYSLTATVDPEAKPRSLAGELSVGNCEGCIPVKFNAIQESQNKK